MRSQYDPGSRLVHGNTVKVISYFANTTRLTRPSLYLYILRLPPSSGQHDEIDRHVWIPVPMLSSLLQPFQVTDVGNQWKDDLGSISYVVKGSIYEECPPSFQ